MQPVLIVLLGLGLFTVLGGALDSVLARRNTRLEQRRLQQLGTAQVEKAAAKPLLRTVIADRLEKAVTRRGFAQTIRGQLQEADLKLRVSEYIMLQVLAVAAAAVLSWFVLGKSVFFSVLGALGGLIAPRFLIRQLAKARLRSFNNQLGDTLNLWVNVLRSGYSVLQAMETIASESPPPVSTEFERVVQEVRLGLTAEQALANLLIRVPSDDMDLVVTAINIQREVGGNLAEVLSTISHTIRERIRIKGEIAILTAQASVSGSIISLLPIALTLFLRLSNPDYINELFIRESPWVFPGVVPCGWLLLALGMVLIFSGYMAMRKIADIEI